MHCSVRTQSRRIYLLTLLESTRLRSRNRMHWWRKELLNDSQTPADINTR
jgi:hypothetical protein